MDAARDNSSTGRKPTIRSLATGASESTAAHSPRPKFAATDSKAGTANGMAASATAGNCVTAPFADKAVATVAMEAVLPSNPSERPIAGGLVTGEAADSPDVRTEFVSESADASRGSAVTCSVIPSGDMLLSVLAVWLAISVELEFVEESLWSLCDFAWASFKDNELEKVSTSAVEIAFVALLESLSAEELELE